MSKNRQKMLYIVIGAMGLGYLIVSLFLVEDFDKLDKTDLTGIFLLSIISLSGLIQGILMKK